MLSQIADSMTPKGWAWFFPYAYGGLAPIKFSAISYAGHTPTDGTGLTWQLLIKAARSDLDSAAIIDAVEADMTILDTPLIVGYNLDTLTAGFEPGTAYYGELWVVDPTYGRQMVAPFIVALSSPLKLTYP